MSHLSKYCRQAVEKDKQDKLVIVTQQGKFSYTFAPLLMNAADAANLLAQVFGTTVKLR